MSALAAPDVQPEFARVRSGRTLHAIKEGWMYKKGGKSFSSFRKRYMILWTNKRIEYYEDDKLNTMKGTVNLLELNKRAIQRSDKVPKNKNMFGFQILTEKRTWYFAVQGEDEREDWIRTIRAVVHILDPSPSASPNISPAIAPVAPPPMPDPEKQDLPKKERENSDSDTFYFEPPPDQDEPLLQPADQEDPEKEKVVLQYPHKEKEDSAPSDYDPEEVLEQMELEYDQQHNPHRQGKKAQGIQWDDDDDGDGGDSLNEDEDEEEDDPDIDVAYNWKAQMSKIEDKMQEKQAKKESKHPDKQSIHWDGNEMDGELESDDSLNDSENEEEEQPEPEQKVDEAPDEAKDERTIKQTHADQLHHEEIMDLAAYQKYVYENDQPMMRMSKELENETNEFSNKRQAIDWDEDEFDTDSLSQQTEGSEQDQKDKEVPDLPPPPAAPSTKKQKTHNEEAEKEIVKELAFINEGHIILRLFQKLDQYLSYKPNEKGRGIWIEQVKPNKYGKQLHIKYGFDADALWYVESIDTVNITKKTPQQIKVMLNQCDLTKGYQVVFKRSPRSKSIVRTKSIRVPKKKFVPEPDANSAAAASKNKSTAKSKNKNSKNAPKSASKAKANTSKSASKAKTTATAKANARPKASVKSKTTAKGNKAKSASVQQTSSKKKKNTKTAANNAANKQSNNSRKKTTKAKG